MVNLRDVLEILKTKRIQRVKKVLEERGLGKKSWKKGNAHSNFSKVENWEGRGKGDRKGRAGLGTFDNDRANQQTQKRCRYQGKTLYRIQPEYGAATDHAGVLKRQKILLVITGKRNFMTSILRV